MSFFGDILEGVGSFLGIGNNAGSSGNGANLAKTALLGFALNQITSSLNKENDALKQTQPYRAQVDQGVRLQVSPSANQKIPVCYGRSTLGGIITDARPNRRTDRAEPIRTDALRHGRLRTDSPSRAASHALRRAEGTSCPRTVERSSGGPRSRSDDGRTSA